MEAVRFCGIALYVCLAFIVINVPLNDTDWTLHKYIPKFKRALFPGLTDSNPDQYPLDDVVNDTLIQYSLAPGTVKVQGVLRPLTSVLHSNK